ncbi:PIN domain-containing protein [Nocardia goodfellowii]|uniref:DUF4935 domain-containing protein n=1 Tax=Nocardia goodfellowii TaxID=882446 RepID=A0ABS4QF50_9NOCA|nr:PIN domain-containing protein [Nocardia goodfellowii]MBP2190198.1 hypothetical protein [Nocardia goodfellowii]
MPVIVVDTNIFRGSPMLRAPAWRSLADHRVEWGIKLIVPEVVIVETVHMMRKHWENTQTAVDELQVGQFAVGHLQKEMADTIAAYCENYEQSLRGRLAELGAEIVAPPPIDYMDIVRRAVFVDPPYGGKEAVDGFRDAVIWHTLLAVAAERSDQQVWFVSNNTGDFGPSDEKWTKETRNKCPIPFHEKLAAELDALGLTDRVQYVTSLERLEQNIAAHFAPIEGEALEKLVSRIDQRALDDRLNQAIAGVRTSARDAALDLNAVGAVAHAATACEGAGSWVFEEAARRGADVWTAQFTVDADVDLNVYRTDASTTALTKTLQVSGDITIGSDDVATHFTITRIAALPDDPMLAAWERRAKALRRSRFSGFLTPEASVAILKSITPQLPKFEIPGIAANLAGVVPPSMAMDFISPELRAGILRAAWGTQGNFHTPSLIQAIENARLDSLESIDEVAPSSSGPDQTSSGEETRSEAAPKEDTATPGKPGEKDRRPHPSRPEPGEASLPAQDPSHNDAPDPPAGLSGKPAKRGKKKRPNGKGPRGEKSDS